MINPVILLPRLLYLSYFVCSCIYIISCVFALCLLTYHLYFLASEKISSRTTKQPKQIDASVLPAEPVHISHKDWRDDFPGITAKLAYLLYSGEKSDVTLRVDNGYQTEEIKAHKLILSSASAYFDILFFGSVSTNRPEYTIAEEYPKSFADLIRLVYSGGYEIPSLEAGIELYILADKYLCLDATIDCRNYLLKNISAKNMGLIFNFACTYQDADVQKQCLTFWRDNAQEVISSKSLNDVSLENAMVLLNENSLRIHNELELFRAVRDNELWCKGDSNIFLRLLKSIRYLTMSAEDFGEVVNSNLLSMEQCFAIMTHLSFSPDSVLPLPEGFSDSKVVRTRY